MALRDLIKFESGKTDFSTEKTMSAIIRDSFGDSSDLSVGDGVCANSTHDQFVYQPHQSLFSPSTVVAVSELLVESSIKVDAEDSTSCFAMRFINYEELRLRKRFISGFQGSMSNWARDFDMTEKDLWLKLSVMIYRANELYENVGPLYVDFNKLHQIVTQYGFEFAESVPYFWVKTKLQLIDLSVRSLLLTGIIPDLSGPDHFMTPYLEGVDINDTRVKTAFWKIKLSRYCRWSLNKFNLQDGIAELKNITGDGRPVIPLEHAVMSTGMYHVHYYRDIAIQRYHSNRQFPNGIHNLVYHLIEWLTTKDRALDKDMKITATNMFDIPSLATWRYYNLWKPFSKSKEFYKVPKFSLTVAEQVDLLIRFMWYVALTRTWPVKLYKDVIKGDKVMHFYYADYIFGVITLFARSQKSFFNVPLHLTPLSIRSTVYVSYLDAYLSMRVVPKFPPSLTLLNKVNIVDYVNRIQDPVSWLIALCSFDLTRYPKLENISVMSYTRFSAALYAIFTYFGVDPDITFVESETPDPTALFSLAYINLYINFGTPGEFDPLFLDDIQQRLHSNMERCEFNGVIPCEARDVFTKIQDAHSYYLMDFYSSYRMS